jgi:transposase
MIKAHKIRLNPTDEQKVYFAKAAGTARFVWNWALAEWNRHYEAGERPTALKLKKQFEEEPEKRRAAVGIDVGLNRLATLSTAEGYENQAFLKTALGKLRQAGHPPSPWDVSLHLLRPATPVDG